MDQHVHVHDMRVLVYCSLQVTSLHSSVSTRSPEKPVSSRDQVQNAVSNGVIASDLLACALGTL